MRGGRTVAEYLSQQFGVSVAHLLGTECVQSEMTSADQQAEAAVLHDMASMMADLTARLPPSSSWRPAFVSSRRELLAVIEDGV